MRGLSLLFLSVAAFASPATPLSAQHGIARYELELPAAGGMVVTAFDAEGRQIVDFVYPRDVAHDFVAVRAIGKLEPAACDHQLVGFLEQAYLCQLTEDESPCWWADFDAQVWLQGCRQ